ncbi:RimJ/RimL family protein N-acetyltransferase [Rubricella aquisinus]|uniref:RimJ/RimL family protein N-acetyltransferase n=1 Tax=Rubricella aquisinus TaxID=2028108 RepID=A0A840WPA9_9RHOB|nr:GNAT family protein [Rubricella aquisinus]MBB5516471.1 RimJ/RimL family protein N-acetyltransferase [Rubricella aquisinus]
MVNGPILETARLALRPLRGSDAGLISLYLGDARVAKMTGSIPHPYPPGAAEGFVTSRATSAEISWAMDATLTDGPEFIGVIGAVPQGAGVEAVGYWVGPPFWNTGYATEALEAVLSQRFDAGITTITARVFQDNPQSAKVLTHCGFEYLGDSEGFCVARNATLPQWDYALTRDAWTARKELS